MRALILAVLITVSFAAETTRKDVDAAANAYLLAVANYAMTMPKPSVPRPSKEATDSKAEDAKRQAADFKWRRYDATMRHAEMLRAYVKDPNPSAVGMSEAFAQARQLHTGLAASIEYVRAP
jgi:hypothetical protein